MLISRGANPGTRGDHRGEERKTSLLHSCHSTTLDGVLEARVGDQYAEQSQTRIEMLLDASDAVIICRRPSAASDSGGPIGMMTPSATISTACVNASKDAGQSTNIQSKSAVTRSRGLLSCSASSRRFKGPHSSRTSARSWFEGMILSPGQPLSRIAEMSLSLSHS
jgi:hypothetical protein